MPSLRSVLIGEFLGTALLIVLGDGVIGAVFAMISTLFCVMVALVGSAAAGREIRDELDRMLGPGGFSSGRDIAAVTVNRWPHGYGYVANSLFDGDDYDNVLAQARQRVGRVAIANSDAGGDAYAHLAIEQAARAVRELTG